MIETHSYIENLPETARFSEFMIDGYAGSLPWSYSSVDESVDIIYDAPPQQAETHIDSKESICFIIKNVVSVLPGIGRLSKPIPIELTIEYSGLSLSCEELALYANGETTQEVWEEFISLFQEQFEYYTSLRTDRLSDRSAMIRHNYLTVFPPKK